MGWWICRKGRSSCRGKVGGLPFGSGFRHSPPTAPAISVRRTPKEAQTDASLMANSVLYWVRDSGISRYRASQLNTVAGPVAVAEKLAALLTTKNTKKAQSALRRHRRCFRKFPNNSWRRICLMATSNREYYLYTSDNRCYFLFFRILPAWFKSIDLNR